MADDLFSGLTSAASLLGSAVPGVGTGMALAGLGLKIFGGISGMDAASKENQAQQQMVGTELQQEDVRHKAMEIQARRLSIENNRNAVKARAMALNSAAQSGTGASSGISGGMSQISGQAGWNQSGISTNLQQGEQMFDLTKQLSMLKMSYAQAGGQANTAAGLGALGGDLMGTMKTMNEFFPGAKK